MLVLVLVEAEVLEVEVLREVLEEVLEVEIEVEVEVL